MSEQLNELGYDPKFEFRMGWTDDDLRQQYYAGVYEGDCHVIADAVEAQGAERRPTFSAVFGAHSPDLDLLEDYPVNAPLPGSEAFDDEAKFLHELAALRDEPLAEMQWVGDAYRGLWDLSVFWQDYEVDGYPAGVDYGESDEDFLWLMAGWMPKVDQAVDGKRLISTGRDLAALVNGDDTLAHWRSVARQCLAWGVPFRQEGEQEVVGDDNFAQGLWFDALVAECVARTSLLSFRRKHARRIPRLYQYGMDRWGVLIPMAYNYANPMHESQDAMHSGAALTIAAALNHVFRRNWVVPATGRTLAEEIDLKAENEGLGRLWAGVHYLSDHECGREMWTALGRRIAMEKLHG